MDGVSLWSASATASCVAETHITHAPTSFIELLLK